MPKKQVLLEVAQQIAKMNTLDRKTKENVGLSAFLLNTLLLFPARTFSLNLEWRHA